MSKGSFNGFDPKEIVELFKFIIAVGDFKKDKSGIKLNEYFPLSSEWENKIGFNDISFFPTTMKLSQQRPNPDNGFYVSNTQNSQLKSLLYHLKEAIINGNINKEGNYVIFEKTEEKSSLFGKLKYSNFKSFIKLFINNK